MRRTAQPPWVADSALTHTHNLPRGTVADHDLPQVPLNDGLSDDLHAARTMIFLIYLSRLGFTTRDVTIFNLSIC